MSPFSTKLRLEFEDGRDWLLTETFSYLHDDGRSFVVPAGFRTDFASVPRFFWRVFPPAGRYAPAAVLHDMLYRTGLVSRRDADAIFYTAMKALGVFLPTRYILWLAVRLFGWTAYQKSV